MKGNFDGPHKDFMNDLTHSNNNALTSEPVLFFFNPSTKERRLIFSFTEEQRGSIVSLDDLHRQR